MDQALAPNPATDEHHQVGDCGIQGNFSSRPAIFDSLGTELLQNIPHHSTVLMDELGFMELKAPHFCQKVRKILDQPCQVIGVIKEKSNPFLDDIRQHPLVRTVELRRDNYQAVLALVIAFLKQPSLAASLDLLPPGNSPVRQTTTPFDHSIAPLGQAIALVGSGGKTTLLYMLARELAAAKYRVVVTTSTHIYLPQIHQVPQTLLFDDASSADIITTVSEAIQQHGLIAIGTRSAGGKMTSLSLDLLDRLTDLADFILIEADGSKQLPIKAWADHEPVLPTCTSMVLILAGLSCLEKPLSATCHRPQLAAEWLGCSLEHPLMPDDLVTLICQLLKRLSAQQPQAISKPPRFTVILNQADYLQPHQLDMALDIITALECLSFHQIFLAQLHSAVPFIQYRRCPPC